MKKETQKDPSYQQKLDTKSKLMYGRPYRFLNKEQKHAVASETKFEPKQEEANEQPKREAPKEAPILKDEKKMAQYRCKAGHKTKGEPPHVPIVSCRVGGCKEKPELIGHYINDQFVPLNKN